MPGSFQVVGDRTVELASYRNSGPALGTLEARDPMPITREQLHQLVERLPEQEIAAAQRFLLFLAQETINEDFGRSIRRGLDQSEAGQTVVCRDYQDMVDQVLGD